MECKGQFYNQETGYSVIFDDNGRVAYAYLINEIGNIVGDVWLYNRCVVPKEPEWSDVEKAPFANSSDYVKYCDEFSPVDEISDVAIKWDISVKNEIKAMIFVRNLLLGILIEGSKPGWSIFAAKDGPLAKFLE